MLTTIWFVRHAEADPRVSDPPSRPLTEKGLKDRETVRAFLKNIPVTCAFSSPYQRAVDTIRLFADEAGLPIQTDMALAEFHAGKISPEGAFLHYIEMCFEDPARTQSGGESFRALIRRQEKYLSRVLLSHAGENIVIGTHGIALSALIHHYAPSFGFADYLEIAGRMPIICRMTFDGNVCTQISLTDPINPYSKTIHLP